MTAPSAGKYDPVPAQFMNPVFQRVKGEDKITGYTEAFAPRNIRFPWQARYGWEQGILRQTQSTGQIIIRVRRDPETIAITPATQIWHNGAVYGIIAPQPLPDYDELEFLCQYKTPAVSAYIYA